MICPKCLASSSKVKKHWVPPHHDYYAGCGLKFKGECMVHECQDCGWAAGGKPMRPEPRGTPISLEEQ